MSLRDLANNLRTEDEFHTFVKRERVIPYIVFTTYTSRDVRHHSLLTHMKKNESQMSRRA